MSGIKYDTGKVDMGLLFREVPYGLEEVSKALQMGSEKYGVGNWLKVDDGNSRYLSALVRHLTTYYQGERKDPESGLSHLAHVATNALFLLDQETRNDNDCLSERSVSSRQPNDRWVTAEIRQIQENLHPEEFLHYGAEGASVCSSGERLKSASPGDSVTGGIGCTFNTRYEG